MLSASQWIRIVFAPLLLILVVDQVSKQIAESNLSVVAESVTPWLSLQLHHNYGFMLGGMHDLSKLYTVVVPSTLGAFLFYLFAVIQYFLPIYSPTMRVGLSIFAGGVLSNIVDRARWGFVVDFIQLRGFGLTTGVMNIADILQWFGVAVFLGSFLRHSRFLYPQDERRKRKWIDSEFQGRYCATLVLVGFFFAVITGLLSYTFLRTSLESGLVQPEMREQFAQGFISVFAGASLLFFITLFVLGVHLSHRVIGPVRNFEGFLDGVLQGRMRTFKLRDRDEFAQFEVLAERFQKFFVENLGVTPAALEEKNAAPSISGVTYDGKLIEPGALAGRRVWLIFYRYATCPLCVGHLDSVRETIGRAKAAGVSVMAVFESRPDQFLKDGTGMTSAILQESGIPLIADPERILYRKFRAQVRRAAAFKPSVLLALWRARKRGIFQESIDGELGQLPAHFLIERDGTIFKAYYAADLTDHPPVAWLEPFLNSP